MHVRRTYPLEGFLHLELNIADGAEVACQPRDFDPRLIVHWCEGDPYLRLRPPAPGRRTAHGDRHKRVKARAVEISQRSDGLTHLGQPFARWDHDPAPPAWKPARCLLTPL